MIFSLSFSPKSWVYGWEVGIAVYCLFNFGYIKSICVINSLAVNLGSADDHNFFIGVGCKSSSNFLINLYPRRNGKIFLSGNNNISDRPQTAPKIFLSGK